MATSLVDLTALHSLLVEICDQEEDGEGIQGVILSHSDKTILARYCTPQWASGWGREAANGSSETNHEGPSSDPAALAGAISSLIGLASASLFASLEHRVKARLGEGTEGNGSDGVAGEDRPRTEKKAGQTARTKESSYKLPSGSCWLQFEAVTEDMDATAAPSPRLIVMTTNIHTYLLNILVSVSHPSSLPKVRAKARLLARLLNGVLS